LLRAIAGHAQNIPSNPALIDDAGTLTYAELHAAIVGGAQALQDAGISTLVLLADNGIPWVVGDLAARHAQTPCVPLPHFFSPTQLVHALSNSGADGILTDRAPALAMLLEQAGIAHEVEAAGQGMALIRLRNATAAVLPSGTVKVTYTSGTTGDPKGVCLGGEHIETVVQSLYQATSASAADRHVCLTPLSTLLENLGGVYVPLLAGACCCVPSLKTVGLSGAAGLDALQMVKALRDFQATTAIMAPQMLQALVSVVAQGGSRPSRLRFVAVGGAAVSPRLLIQAEQVGIPVFEGYGLSECASVVSLNTPASRRTGSTGRALPHLALHIAEDGEVLVEGPLFLGYIGHPAPQNVWATGDIGHRDADGFLYITGRKKNMFITSFGRNVSPEWVETMLLQGGAIMQAAVFGEGRPWSMAVIVAKPGTTDTELQLAIDEANGQLPDYARIGAWLRADSPFSSVNGLLTPNGRLRRDAILETYRARIGARYEVHPEEEFHAVL
jgi:long-subunit acyl-CoA synthetase (AMP-forming)